MNELFQNILSCKEIDNISKKLKKENKLSLVFKNNPKMLFLDLPAEFKGEAELHEFDDDLYVVLEGEANLEIEESSHTISKGDIIHIPAGKKHKLVFTKQGIKYIVVKINKGK